MEYKVFYPFSKYCFKLNKKFPFIKIIENDYRLPYIITLMNSEGDLK